MKVRLRVDGGHNAGRLVPIAGRRFLIGRAEDCQLRPLSAAASPYQCALLLESGHILVRDLGGKSGTFVNGRRVCPEVELKNGDRLQVGQLEFEVQIKNSSHRKARRAAASVPEAVRQATTVARPLSEDDTRLDDWLAESADQSVTGTALTEDTPEGERVAVSEAETRAQQRVVAPAESAPHTKRAAPNSEESPPSELSPVSEPVAEAAGEILNQLLRKK